MNHPKPEFLINLEVIKEGKVVKESIWDVHSWEIKSNGSLEVTCYGGWVHLYPAHTIHSVHIYDTAYEVDENAVDAGSSVEGEGSVARAGGLPGRVWFCKIGLANDLPDGADLPMRMAVREAYGRLTGEDPDFLFSGWGGSLDEVEMRVAGLAPPHPDRHASRTTPPTKEG